MSICEPRRKALEPIQPTVPASAIAQTHSYHDFVRAHVVERGNIAVAVVEGIAEVELLVVHSQHGNNGSGCSERQANPVVLLVVPLNV